MDWNSIDSSLGPMKPFVDIFLSLLLTTGPFILIALAINSFLTRLIRKEWIHTLAIKYGHIWIIRYTILPFLSLFAFTNPSCYEVGNHLDEKHKPAFYDAAVSFCHPITAFFPFSNSGELFCLIGPLYPLIKLKLSLFHFAIAYFIAGIVVMAIRGTLTEILTRKFMKKI